MGHQVVATDPIDDYFVIEVSEREESSKLLLRLTRSARARI